MYLLDAQEFPPNERLDAVQAVLDEGWATDIVFDRRPEDLTFQIQIETLGPVTVTRTISNGLDVRLRPTRAEVSSAPSLALQMHAGAVSRFVQGDRREELADSGALLNDLTQPYEFAWSGVGTSSAVVLDLAYAGLPLDRVRQAATLPLIETPLGRLVLNHIRYVVENIDTLTTDAEHDDVVARTTSDLIRALVTQVHGDDRVGVETWNETEVTRILAFARAHLRRRDLTPASIAAAHFISERHLYRLCHQAGFSLSDWIVQRRLEGTRTELADPSSARRPIAAVAASWGFSSAAHFSRKFSDEYGVPPSDWRRLHLNKSTNLDGTTIRRVPDR